MIGGIKTRIMQWKENKTRKKEIVREIEQIKNEIKPHTDKIDELEKEKKSLKRPFIPYDIDISLPFFTYGIFKPGQIACMHIEPFINKRESKKYMVHGHRLMRDGLYMIKDANIGNVGKEIDGYLLKFDDPEKAYNAISELEPSSYYQWDTNEEKTFNYLAPKGVKRGIDIDDEKELNDHDFSNIGFNDPFFNQGLDMVIEKDTSESDIFTLQMKYLFLSSIIERFAFLSINFRSQANKLWTKDIGESNTFNYSFDKMLRNNEFHYLKKEIKSPTRNIFSTKDLAEVVFVNNPMEFYYQLRNNITHRGKAKGRITKDKLATYKKELEYLLESMLEYQKEQAEKLKNEIDKYNS